MSVLEDPNKKKFVDKLRETASFYKVQSTYIECNGEAYFLCGPGLQQISMKPDKLSRLINAKSDQFAHENNVAVFKLTGCDPSQTYCAVTECCENINYLRPIYENRFINNLDKMVENFGLCGTYVIYEKGVDSDFSGIYFVCGTDRNKVLNGDIDIRQIVDDCKKDDAFFHYQLQAFPLHDSDPFAVHQDVLEYCRNAEFLVNLYKEYNEDMPETVSYPGLITMKLCYTHSHSMEIAPERRELYEKSLNDCFNIEDSYHNPDNPDYDKGNRVEKNKFNSWMKKRFGQNNNKVSLEQVFSSSTAPIGHMTVNISIAQELEEELSKRPDILYWMSKPGGPAFEFPEGEGFGPNPDDNEIRAVNIAFSQAYADDVINILNKICHPEACQTSMKEMAERGESISTMEIPSDEYDNFLSLCRTNGVEFCIDNSLKSQEAGYLNIAFPAKYNEIVDAILTRLSRESEEFHITPNDAAKEITIPTTTASRPRLNVPQIDYDGAIGKPSSADRMSAVRNAFPDSNFEIIKGSFDDLDH